MHLYNCTGAGQVMYPRINFRDDSNEMRRCWLPFFARQALCYAGFLNEKLAAVEEGGGGVGRGMRNTERERERERGERERERERQRGGAGM